MTEPTTGPPADRLDDDSRRDATPLDTLDGEVIACRRCPRLVEWRERVGVEKRSAFRDDDYWARPVPGFGDPDPWCLLVGLAPAAHGANRTGRVFTGDRSADFLTAALHRAGLANQPTSLHRADGLRLSGCRITLAVRCAPPGNHPTRTEEEACRAFLAGEIAALTSLTVVVALGAFAWAATLGALEAPRPRPAFAHGAAARVGGLTLLGSYHPSQQNTFTGRLTPAMLDDVLVRAKATRATAEVAATCTGSG